MPIKTVKIELLGTERDTIRTIIGDRESRISEDTQRLLDIIEVWINDVYCMGIKDGRNEVE